MGLPQLNVRPSSMIDADELIDRLKEQLCKAARNFTAQDYFGFDAAVEPPPDVSATPPPPDETPSPDAAT